MGTNSGHTRPSSGRHDTGTRPTYHRRTYRVRHCSRGLSRTTVSNIDRGAGSVGLSARPALPSTDSTSGTSRSIASCRWSCRRASSTEMPGSVVGMYSTSPSSSGGMNSRPNRGASGSADTTAITPSSTVVTGLRSATCTKGAYTLRIARLTG
jgi:hypothetical protein